MSWPFTVTSFALRELYVASRVPGGWSGGLGGKLGDKAGRVALCVAQTWYCVPSETSEILWPVPGEPHTSVVVRLVADNPSAAMVAVPEICGAVGV